MSKWTNGRKICPDCGVEKPVEEYAKDPTTKNGYSPYCRKCKNIKRAGYDNTVEGKVLRRARHKRYSKTEKHKAQMKRFRLSPKGRIVRRRAKLKRQKGFGFNPLNKIFIGAVGHHVNNQDIVYIPEMIHNMARNCSRGIHRKVVLEHYGSLENMIKCGG